MKKIMVLLKRNLEGFRVHSYVAACTANLQELYLSQSGVLLLFCFVDGGVGTARMQTGIGNRMLLQ
jgi:hypothetical protein